MATKKFKIEFYMAEVGEEGRAGYLSELLDNKNISYTPHCSIGEHIYELRSFDRINGGYKGIFAKVRQSDIPHAGAPGGSEREIDLADGEGLLEKNHFLFFRDLQLLVDVIGN